ncbi:hypothetical protein CTAYLR_009825 [Chrysophaeum taylorii]|uniref:Impact N-terminal domain-containing protein n=1 Tax=Chrysophaeum taylorii TaxID=2483200 RepID=A0AAD7XKG6_9STRA|nr:hypothetical protein CTAYLR_009825 [Chrysophaeum taylorii]
MLAAAVMMTSVVHEVRRSRFVAHAAYARSWIEAERVVAAERDPKARHNCFAWLGRDSARSSDDGEPSGTAGKPIREAIAGEGVDGVVCVVARYKAPTAPQLGAGGLVRAYGAAARLAVRELLRDQVIETVTLRLAVPVADAGKLHAFVASWPTTILARRDEYTSTTLRLDLEVPEGDAADLEARARRLLPTTLRVHHPII